MSNIKVDYDILNQKQTPAFYASSLATRPAFGFPGRIFIDTDTPSSGIYRDTGSAWVQVADPGAGTTGTLQQVTTNGNTTTLGIQVQGININDGTGTGLGNTAIGSSNLSVNTTGQYNTAIGFNSLISNISGINNTAVGVSTLTANTTGRYNTAIGNGALTSNTNAEYNTAIGFTSLTLNTTGANNTALGNNSLASNTTASFNTAIGGTSLQLNTTGANNTAVGYQSLTANTTGANNTALGLSALSGNTTASFNTAIGSSSLVNNTTGTQNVAIGYLSLSTNLVGNQNVAIGNNALQNSTASQNTAIGHLALNINTTGANSTAIGNQALQLNTTGTQNTAIGSGALANNTTANYNTAVGTSSLGANTTGNNNTAVGLASLQTNTTGSNNVAVGFVSLNANTSGANNTSVGYASLQVNSTGGGNTGIGYGSLSSNTTGGNNTALGSSALIGSITGSNNTAVGSSALSGNTTGLQNSAYGGGSLSGITTGSNNTAIGYASGGAITTGSNNTIIGKYVGTTTLTSNIVLADGLGNVRLFSDANGLIGINQAVGSTIGGQLDIHTSQTYALVLNGLTTNNAYTAFSNNNVGKWRIGNTYNAGANSFDIFNLGTSSNAVRFFSANNYAYFGSLPSSVVYMRYNFNVGTDLNIGFRSDSSRCRIEATNDAVSANIPIDFIGSAYSFGNNSPVLINTTTDDTINKLQVNGSIKNIGNLTNTSSNFQSFGSSSFAASTWGISIGNGSVSANYVKANDNFFQNGVGTQTFYINTSGVVQITNLAGTGSRAVLADASGNLSAPVSDISVKENINSIGYGLNQILKMNPVWFNYNNEYKNYGEGRQNGNIAQEMEAIIPEAVFTTPITGKMGINYDQLHAVYIKAIQELNEKLVRNNIN